MLRILNFNVCNIINYTTKNDYEKLHKQTFAILQFFREKNWDKQVKGFHFLIQFVYIILIFEAFFFRLHRARYFLQYCNFFAHPPNPFFRIKLSELPDLATNACFIHLKMSKVLSYEEICLRNCYISYLCLGPNNLLHLAGSPSVEQFLGGIDLLRHWYINQNENIYK